jgi:hypothetical protein
LDRTDFSRIPVSIFVSTRIRLIEKMIKTTRQIIKNSVKFI